MMVQYGISVVDHLSLIAGAGPMWDLIDKIRLSWVRSISQFPADVIQALALSSYPSIVAHRGR